MNESLSTTTVARLVGVAVGSVQHWIDTGQLKGGRTPGGHRRIQPRDLVEFLRRQGLPVPPELMPSPTKVLIVDDDESVTSSVTDGIKAKHPDFEVLAAHDGFAAGELVRSARPDVVILDLRMPGLDGFEVCRRIKSMEDMRPTTVLAITARPSPAAKRRILQSGAAAYLAKPLKIETLLQELEKALGRPGRGASGN